MRPGERFDRYLIESLLGRGGMGEVYRAYDERLRRRVALKLLRPDGDPAGPEAVLREARAAAALRHPNAVAVYDVAEWRGRAFLTMELLEGRPLRSLVGAEGVPLGARLRWLRQAAAVLGEAHRLGLVHRDVKPDNMFVCDDGTLKLLDFGIAKLVDADGPPSASGRRAGPRGGGGVESEIIGTPLYMAPERTLGVRADARSDQFAWGVVAFELVAGRHPRESGVARERWADLLVARGLGPALAQVVLRAFRVAPEARFGSMFELAAAWDAALAVAPPAAPLATTDPAAPSATADPAAAAARRATTDPAGARRGGTPPPAEAGPPATSGGAPAGDSSRPAVPWHRRLGRPASDAELAAFGVGLLVVVAVGAGLVALDVGRRRGGPLVASASASASASAKAGPLRCAPDGPELAIAEGVADGRGVSSLVTAGGGVYAFAAAPDPARGTGGRPWRLHEGGWRPLEVERAPGGFEPLPGRSALGALDGGPALFVHNGRAIDLEGFDAPPGATPPRYLMVPRRHTIHSFALADRGETTALAVLGYATVEGARVPAGRAALLRRGCAPQAFDLDAGAALIESTTEPGSAGPARPLVAVGEGKAAVAFVRSDASLAVTRLEFEAPCGLVRFGAEQVQAFLKPALAFHRGELYWAGATSLEAFVVGDAAGHFATLRGNALLHGVSLASNDDVLALAWADEGDESEGPARAMFSGLRPREARPETVALGEGRGLRDVNLRATPGGAFVTWVRGASLRGRAVRCAAE